MDDIASKTIDGITDLVVVAPIKEGFIEAYENVTYATRLKLVAEALNRIRVTAREYERVTPFSDVTERILNLLDFRIGVLDNDMFGLTPDPSAPQDGINAHKLSARRYLYLAATFEGGWEPYMRLIWHPLGPFLDLLFCNCENYVSATEHGCEEYLQWVRDNQVDSAIFYSTTGLTIRDQRYLSRLERLQRSGASETDLTSFTMPYPDRDAAQTRMTNPAKAVELGLEAVNVLYKLADYYPPEWLTGDAGNFSRLKEGHRLVRATAEMLQGFEQFLPMIPAEAKKIYAEPLHWFTTGTTYFKQQDAARISAAPPDPTFAPSEVQGGIISPQGSRQNPVRFGAMLMFTIRDAASARAFINKLMDDDKIHFESDGRAAKSASKPAAKTAAKTTNVREHYYNISFTAHGLQRIGLDPDIVDRFPKEFREGPAARSGLLGDMRENHPRNWILPERNGPEFAGIVPPGTQMPPVEWSEVDFIIQIRSTMTGDEGEQALRQVVLQCAQEGGEGATLEALEWMHINYAGIPGDSNVGLFHDHFGYLDGLSQPRPPEHNGKPAPGVQPRDQIKRGEILLGYGNDRTDIAPGAFASLEADGMPYSWRKSHRSKAQAIQLNGSFLVIRKIGQDADALEQWLETEADTIKNKLGLTTKQDASAILKAKIMGRDANGKPLTSGNSTQINDFDYEKDAGGIQCPHAAHIRRANPRRTMPPSPLGSGCSQAEFGRPTPRLVRRGMLFGGKDAASAGAQGPRGLMFMAYCGSIAEQYEIIQRWLNGGNSTDIVSANNDPLSGVCQKEGGNYFAFVHEDALKQKQVVRVKLPDPDPKGGRHPFSPLYWTAYLFAPSRSALKQLASLDTDFRPIRKMKEASVGKPWLERLTALPIDEKAKEWKRALEDFIVKDPTQADVTPNIWSAIRWYHGGAVNLSMNVSGQAKAASGTYDWDKPKHDQRLFIICAGTKQVNTVLSDWKNFSVEEQMRRISETSGPVYVTQQPDDDYRAAKLKGLRTNYVAESLATNEILLNYSEKSGFAAGYRAGQTVLEQLKQSTAALQRDSFKLELRRQYIMPALGELCALWYGLPDDQHMRKEGWSWHDIVDAIAPGQSHCQRTAAHCPGDFIAPSRHAFYPLPGPVIEAFADRHGNAILKAAEAFVAAHRKAGTSPNGPVGAAMFNKIADDKVLARNLIGTMVGAIPPMDGNLRGIVMEWLTEKSLWRHQAALRRKADGGSTETSYEAAKAVLYGPVCDAMCKRPAPDLLYRTVTHDTVIAVPGGGTPQGDDDGDSKPDTLRQNVLARQGDLVVVSLVSVAQRSLMKIGTDKRTHGDVSIIFGGKRKAAAQGYIKQGNKVIPDPDADLLHPVHACPAQDMAMGAIMGIMAALLDAGTIQALPAAMIVRISDWPEPITAPQPQTMAAPDS